MQPEMNEEKIYVLRNTLKYLRLFLIWPEEGTDFNLGKMFYLKFVMFTTSTLFILYGSLAHMIVGLYENNAAQIDMDIAVIISMVGSYYFNFSHLSNIKQINDILKDFTNFENFEMPPGYKHFVRKWDKLSTFHFTYYVTLAPVFLAAAFVENKRCIARNEQKGTHEVCGLVMNIWLPFDFDYFALKMILCCYQIYSAFFSYVLSSTISFSIMESMEHVIFRLDYVKKLFVDALRHERLDSMKNSFNHCVRYHNFVIGLMQRLNNAYSTSIFVHVLFTGAILGSVGFHLMKNPHLVTIGLFVGWYLSLVMVATGGQRLIDKATSIGDAIYSTKWYDAENEIQKNIVLVLVRCQKPIVLRAGFFSFMSIEMIVKILKTSYSIITVLKGTNIN